MGHTRSNLSVFLNIPVPKKAGGLQMTPDADTERGRCSSPTQRYTAGVRGERIAAKIEVWITGWAGLQ